MFSILSQAKEKTPIQHWVWSKIWVLPQKEFFYCSRKKHVSRWILRYYNQTLWSWISVPNTLILFPKKSESLEVQQRRSPFLLHISLQFLSHSPKNKGRDVAITHWTNKLSPPFKIWKTTFHTQQKMENSKPSPCA